MQVREEHVTNPLRISFQAPLSLSTRSEISFHDCSVQSQLATAVCGAHSSSPDFSTPICKNMDSLLSELSAFNRAVYKFTKTSFCLFSISMLLHQWSMVPSLSWWILLCFCSGPLRLKDQKPIDTCCRPHELSVEESQLTAQCWPLSVVQVERVEFSQSVSGTTFTALQQVEYKGPDSGDWNPICEDRRRPRPSVTQMVQEIDWSQPKAMIMVCLLSWHTYNGHLPRPWQRSKANDPRHRENHGVTESSSTV